MNEAATDVIVARSRTADRLTTMVVWSFAAHIVVTALVLLIPKPDTTSPPRTVMTISLGGAPGPRTGGMQQIGGRPVQAPPPEQPVKRAETAPAPVPPKMSLPDPKARTRPETAKPEQAPRDATGRTPATGDKPSEGSARSDTQVRGQGFGLSSGGGGGGGVRLEVDFCCPEYILLMQDIIQRNWQQRQGLVGITTMQFTIHRDGTIRDVRVEKSSGFEILDTAARRALVTKLPPLPAEFTNPTLNVHMEFEYSR
jgi:periplasmic protein TonB